MWDGESCVVEAEVGEDIESGPRGWGLVEVERGFQAINTLSN